MIKIATARTEEQWVAIATQSPRRELAAKVAQVRNKAQARRRNPGQRELLPAAPQMEALAREAPVRVGLEMSAEQFARYEALWEQLYKLGGVPAGADRSEVLLEALSGRVDELRGGTSSNASDCEHRTCREPAPRGAHRAKPPGFQIHVHQCPDCERASIQTSGGEKPIGPAEVERIRCDAILAAPKQRARSAIPPRTRREVLARDRHRCRTPGCTRTRFLEIHHRRPAARGGGNEPENLVTLCSACHRLAHNCGTRNTEVWSRESATTSPALE